MLSSNKAKSGAVVGFVIVEIVALPNVILMLFLGMAFLLAYTIAWFLADWLREFVRPSASLPRLPRKGDDDLS